MATVISAKPFAGVRASAEVPQGRKAQRAIPHLAKTGLRKHVFGAPSKHTASRCSIQARSRSIAVCAAVSASDDLLD